MVAIVVAIKVPKGAKTTPFGDEDPREIPCFVSGLTSCCQNCKPLCAGSIPARASNPPRTQYGHILDTKTYHSVLLGTTISIH